MPRPRLAPRAAALCAALVPVLLASADPGATTIPFDPLFGGNCGGPTGAVTALSPTSFLACLQGQDDEAQTDDDVVLLVTGLDGTPERHRLATPFLSNWGPWITVMSSTRCALPAKGADGHWNSADDVVFVLDRLGSENRVLPVVLGSLDANEGHRPVALDAGTLVAATFGADANAVTADDNVALVTDVGGANTVTYLAAPYLPTGGRARPVALSPRSFLVLASGPDATVTTGDDAAYLWTDVGRKNVRTEIPVPNQFRWGASSPVRLSPTRVVVSSAGPDRSEGTGDDVLLLLDRLGTRNSVTAIPMAGIGSDGAGMAVALDDRTLVIATHGADGDRRTDDDSLVLVSDVGRRNVRTEIVVGYLSEDVGSRPVRLDSWSVGMVVSGPDRTFSTSDDRIALVSDLGRANQVSSIPLAGLSDRMNGRLVPVGDDAFLVVNGGPNGGLGWGDDDRVTLVTDAFGAPQMAHFPSVGDGDDTDSAHFPALLGLGRAAFAGPGPDDDFGQGADDVFQVIDGLPDDRSMEVDLMDLRFSASAPDRPARISVKGRMHFDDLVPNLASDVTMTIGNAAQTISSKLLKRRGTKVTYSDPRGRNGFITKVTVSTKDGSFAVKGRGAGTGVESTSAGYVPVALAFGDVLLAEPCVATADAGGLHFRRP